MIEVRVFATLRQGREKIQHIDASAHTSVADILQHLKIAKEDVAICLINGFHASINDAVKDADVISLFPAVGGG